jgi:holo-[acyl-carrier protein] synthase
MQERWDDKFTARVFTSEENEYCRQHKFPARHLAGIFAAKEAVLKAIGTGLSQGISWQEIQILSQIGHAPQVKLSGTAAEVAEKLGVQNVLVSMSHDADYAIAHAVALKGTLKASA